MPYDFVTPDGRYWYAEDIKPNDEDIFWKGFYWDVKKQLSSLSTMMRNPPGFTDKFVMEFTSELGPSAETQLRQAYTDYNTLTTDAPWYEKKLTAKEQAIIMTLADYHGIGYAVAFNKMKDKFLELTGEDTAA